MSARKVVMCSSLGCDEVFKHRMALKRHLARNQCVCVKQLSNATRHVNKCKRPAPITKLSKSETCEYKCTCESTLHLPPILSVIIKLMKKNNWLVKNVEKLFNEGSF